MSSEFANTPKEYEYDAFISYRHVEPDLIVAKKLHRLLENYRIPKSIARQTGINKIRRVFRDEEELPTSGNLSDDIKHALENSRCLIVICSPHTPKSKYCCQEIEEFRKIHGNDRILSILIDGEPDDSFPYPLRFHKEITNNPDGTFLEVEKEVEPLAADIRSVNAGGMWKKLKVEKLRLLAPMLGVKFDDLKQRHREQFVKRVAGMVLAASVFLAVFSGVTLAQSRVIAVQNEEINKKNADLEEINQQLKNQIKETEEQRDLAKKNGDEAVKQAHVAEEQKELALSNEKLAREQRDQALKNMSTYLASLSKAQFQKGDRMMAIMLALKGLPTNLDEPERPYEEIAEGALLQALYSGSKGRAIFKHTGELKTVVFSSDGKKVLTTDWNRKAHIWDTINGEELLSFDNVNNALFSPDGKKLLITNNNSEKILNVDTGKEICELDQTDGFNSFIGHNICKFISNGSKILTTNEHSGEANVRDAENGNKLMSVRIEGFLSSAGISSDGKQLWTVSDKGIVKAWDSVSGKELNEFSILLRIKSTFASTLDDMIWADFNIIFNNDKIVVFRINDSRVYVLDAYNGKLLFRLNQPGGIHSIDLSSGGKTILTSSNNAPPCIWDAEDGKELKEFKSGNGLARISPDGKMVLIAFRNGSVQIFDANTEFLLIDLEGHTDEVTEARFNHDGSQIITASRDQTARLWDINEFNNVNKMEIQSGQFSSCQYSSDGKRILTTTSNTDIYKAIFATENRISSTKNNGVAEIWDAESGNKLARREYGEGTYVHFNKTGSKILTVSLDGTTCMWEADSGSEISKCHIQGDMGTFLGFSPNENRIITADKDNVAHIWDLENGNELAVLKGHKYPIVLAVLSPDGENIVTGSYDDTARIWNLESGKEIAKMVHRGDVTSIQYIQEGTIILTNDGVHPRFWDANTGKELVQKTNNYDLESAYYGFGGSKICSLAEGNTLHLLDSASDQELFRLKLDDVEAGGFPYYLCGFSPEHRELVTNSSDNFVRLWSLESGKELAELQGVSFITFSPDGKRMLMLSEDVRKIIIIELDTKHSIQNALKLLKGRKLDS